MLHTIAEGCTGVLIDHGTIAAEKKNIYIYGFELFWSTTFCIVSILALSIIFGYFDLAVAFLLYFMPVRIPAGGYHAKSYGRCFILTNSVALICVAVSKLLWSIQNIDPAMWLLLLCALACIWINAPVQSKGHPLRPDRIGKNRRYAHSLIVVELVILLLLRCIYYSCVVYTAIVASWAVAIMILLTKKEGRVK